MLAIRQSLGVRSEQQESLELETEKKQSIDTT